MGFYISYLGKVTYNPSSFNPLHGAFEFLITSKEWLPSTGFAVQERVKLTAPVLYITKISFENGLTFTYYTKQIYLCVTIYRGFGKVISAIYSFPQKIDQC